MKEAKHSTKELLLRLRKAEESAKSEEIVLALYEIALRCRQQEEFKDAIMYTEKLLGFAISSNDRLHACLAARSLAEMFTDAWPADDEYARQERTNKANKYLKTYLDLAEKYQWPSEIQISLHVASNIFTNEWCASSNLNDKALLRKAEMYAHKSLAYLDQHAGEINRDKDGVERAENSECRRVRLFCRLASIHANLQERSLADKFIAKAIHSANAMNRKDLVLSCLLAKCDFQWVDAVENAQHLLDVAEQLKSKQDIAIAKFYLSQAACCYSQDMQKAETLLYDIYLNHWKFFDDEFKLAIRNRAILVMRIKSKLSEAQAFAKTRNLKKAAECFEQLGDFACDVDLRFLGCKFYEKFVRYATDIEERKTALSSLAEAFLSCARHCSYHDDRAADKGLRAIEQILSIESKNGHQENGTRVTRFQLLLEKNVSSNIALYELDQLHDIQGSLKDDIYRSYLAYLERNKASDSELAVCASKIIVKDVNEDFDSKADEVRELDEDSAFVMFQACAKEWRANEELKKKVSRRDNSGETELHHAARDGNIHIVRKLVTEFKADVNAKDHGCWTPLHETSCPKIASILIENGADINAQSSLPIDINDEHETGAGITPLMSACFHGARAMIELLLRKHASLAIKNACGYTALDILKLTLKNSHHLEDDERSALETLARRMEEIMLDADLPVTSGDPPPYPIKSAAAAAKKKTILMQRDSQPSQNFSDDDIDLPRTRKRGSGATDFVIPHVDDDEAEIVVESRKRPSSEEQSSFTQKILSRKSNRVLTSTQNTVSAPSFSSFINEKDISPPKKPKRSKTAIDFDDFLDDNPSRKSNLEVNIQLSDNDFDDDLTIRRPTACSNNSEFRSIASCSSTSFEYWGSATPQIPSNKSTPRLQSLVPPNPKVPEPSPQNIRINIKYEDVEGEPLLIDGRPATVQMVSVISSDNFCALSRHPKVIDRLGKRPHLWFLDDIEIDDQMCLNEFSTGSPLSVVCRLKPLEIAEEYKHAAKTPYEDIAEALSKLQTTQMLDLSNSCLNEQILQEIDFVLQSSKLDVSKSISLRHAKLDQLIPTSMLFSSWATRFFKVSELNISASCLSDEHLQAFIEPAQKSNLVRFSVPHNPFTEGKIVANIIIKLSQLAELDLTGSMIDSNVDAVVDGICQCEKLQYLRLTQCKWLISSYFEKIFNECTALQSFLCDGTAVQSFVIEPVAGIELRRLSLAYCKLTHDSVESLIQWVESSKLQDLDISGSPLAIDSILAVVQGRMGSSVSLKISMKATGTAPPSADLIDNLSQFSRGNVVRFRFDPRTMKCLRQNTSFSSTFLF